MHVHKSDKTTIIIMIFDMILKVFIQEHAVHTLIN